MPSALALLIWPLSMLLFGGGFFGARAIAATGFGARGGWVPFRPFPGERASRWARLAVAVAGPIGAYVVAIVLITASALVGGRLEADNRIGVTEGSPAQQAGLRDDDRIVRIGPTDVKTFAEISAALRAQGHAPLELVVDRNGAAHTLVVAPDATVAGPRIGVYGRGAAHRPYDLGEALFLGLIEPPRAMKELFQVLLFPPDSGEIAGPIGLVRTMTAVGPRRSVSAELMQAVGLYGSTWWPGLAIASLIFAVWGWKPR